MCDERTLAIPQAQGLHLMPLLSLEQAITRRQALVEFIQRVMVKGVDYGPGFPGSDKDTLLKPGAERLNSYFGMTPTFHVVEAVEDWTGRDHGGEAFFYFWYKCKVWRGDLLIAEGEGSCNTWESKYRYRKGERTCPACGQAAIIKGKAEYGGGWLCWTKKGGCGAKYPTGDRSIEAQEVGRVLNPDPADQVNTCKKIAQKRALVAAVLLAVNASEFFTQDIEDMADAIESEYTVRHEPAATAQQPSVNRTSNGNGKCPVCAATGNAHAPWCQEVDGGRIDTRKPAAPTTNASQGPTGTSAAQGPAAATTSNTTAKTAAPAPQAKPARVKCSTWNVRGKAFAAEVPYYQKDGNVDWPHLTGAAGKLGYQEINDSNLAEVLDALRQYAADHAALKAEEAQRLADTSEIDKYFPREAPAPAADDEKLPF